VSKEREHYAKLICKALNRIPAGNVSISRGDAEVFLELIIEASNETRECYNMANVGSPLAAQAETTLDKWEAQRTRIKQALQESEE